MTTAALLDVSARRLRLRRRHLAVLGRLARDEQHGDEEAKAELVGAGFLGSDGQLMAAVRPVALAVARTALQLDVARARAGRRRYVEVRWSPAGLLVVPVGPSDLVVDVALQHPSAFARTLLRLLQLGPRPVRVPDHVVGPLTASTLLAPFDGTEPGWLTAIGADPTSATLDRIDLRTDPGAPLVTLALVDTPTGLWEVSSVDSDAFEVRPIAPPGIFATFAAWQRAATRPDCANMLSIRRTSGALQTRRPSS